MTGEPLVEVYRGDLVESVHHVATCACDARGDVMLAVGDIDVPVYLRSAAKPFIAADVVRSGAADRFGFDARELAVMVASHNGEPRHVEAVSGILTKIGLGVDALQCGVTMPSYEPAAAALLAADEKPSALYNNCSGKHAGILATCVHLGIDHAGYLDAAHPVQQRILEFCAAMVGERVADLPLGIDGCGIPVFATSLRRAAHAFAKFATFEGVGDEDSLALATIRAAVLAEPFFLAGSERFDSALIEASGGTVAGKAGAEAVHCDAAIGPGFGLALKVLDGNRRATAPAAVEFLRELGALDERGASALGGFAKPTICNVTGKVVGRVAFVRDGRRERE